MALDAYLPELERRSEPSAAPLRASDEQLTGLPPAFVIVDEADVLRDGGEAYAARLRAAGVAVTTVRYDGITLPQEAPGGFADVMLKAGRS